MAESANSGGETRYKIGDVCRIADVQPYVLRYWESEFPALAPDRSQSGPRTYSERELKLIEQIKRLLYDEGYTIAGAKKRLEGEGAAPAKPEPKPAKETKADTNPAVAPIPPAAARVEKTARPARAPRPVPAAPPEPLKIERRADDDTAPVTAPPAARPAPAPEKTAAVDDERIARAVAELKDVLSLLSRAAP
jgi:DNA-binding transcriptional MerR regulator